MSFPEVLRVESQINGYDSLEPASLPLVGDFATKNRRAKLAGCASGEKKLLPGSHGELDFFFRTIPTKEPGSRLWLRRRLYVVKM